MHALAFWEAISCSPIMLEHGKDDVLPTILVAYIKIQYGVQLLHPITSLYLGSNKKMAYTPFFIYASIFAVVSLGESEYKMTPFPSRCVICLLTV